MSDLSESETSPKEKKISLRKFVPQKKTRLIIPSNVLPSEEIPQKEPNGNVEPKEPITNDPDQYFQQDNDTMAECPGTILQIPTNPPEQIEQTMPDSPAQTVHDPIAILSDDCEKLDPLANSTGQEEPVKVSYGLQTEIPGTISLPTATPTLEPPPVPVCNGAVDNFILSDDDDKPNDQEPEKQLKQDFKMPYPEEVPETYKRWIESHHWQYQKEEITRRMIETEHLVKTKGPNDLNNVKPCYLANGDIDWWCIERFWEKMKTDPGEMEEMAYADAYMWTTLVPEALPRQAGQPRRPKQTDYTPDYMDKTKPASRLSENVLKKLFSKSSRAKKKKKAFSTIDYFSFKYIFFPILEDEHWSLAIVCNPAKAFEKLLEGITRETISQEEDKCLQYSRKKGELDKVRDYKQREIDELTGDLMLTNPDLFTSKEDVDSHVELLDDSEDLEDSEPDSEDEMEHHLRSYDSSSEGIPGLGGGLDDSADESLDANQSGDINRSGSGSANDVGIPDEEMVSAEQSGPMVDQEIKPKLEDVTSSVEKLEVTKAETSTKSESFQDATQEEKSEPKSEDPAEVTGGTGLVEYPSSETTVPMETSNAEHNSGDPAEVTAEPGLVAYPSSDESEENEPDEEMNTESEKLTNQNEQTESKDETEEEKAPELSRHIRKRLKRIKQYQSTVKEIQEELDKLEVVEQYKETDDDPCIYILCSLRSDTSKRKSDVINHLFSHMLIHQEITINEKYREKMIERNIWQLPTEWKEMLPFYYRSPLVPHQINDYDCGWFVITYIDKFIDRQNRPSMTAPKQVLEQWFKPAEIFNRKFRCRNYLNKLLGRPIEEENSEGTPEQNGYLETLEESLELSKKRKEECARNQQRNMLRPQHYESDSYDDSDSDPDSYSNGEYEEDKYDTDEEDFTAERNAMYGNYMERGLYSPRGAFEDGESYSPQHHSLPESPEDDVHNDMDQFEGNSAGEDFMRQINGEIHDRPTSASSNYFRMITDEEEEEDPVVAAQAKLKLTNNFSSLQEIKKSLSDSSLTEGMPSDSGEIPETELADIETNTADEEAKSADPESELAEDQVGESEVFLQMTSSDMTETGIKKPDDVTEIYQPDLNTEQTKVLEPEITEKSEVAEEDPTEKPEIAKDSVAVETSNITDKLDEAVKPDETEKPGNMEKPTEEIITEPDISTGDMTKSDISEEKVEKQDIPETAIHDQGDSLEESSETNKVEPTLVEKEEEKVVPEQTVVAPEIPMGKSDVIAPNQDPEGSKSPLRNQETAKMPKSSPAKKKAVLMEVDNITDAVKTIGTHSPRTRHASTVEKKQAKSKKKQETESEKIAQALYREEYRAIRPQRKSSAKVPESPKKVQKSRRKTIQNVPSPKTPQRVSTEKSPAIPKTEPRLPANRRKRARPISTSSNNSMIKKKPRKSAKPVLIGDEFGQVEFKFFSHKQSRTINREDY